MQEILGSIAIGVPVTAAFPQAGPAVYPYGGMHEATVHGAVASSGCMPVLSDSMPTWRRPVSLEERIREKYQGMQQPACIASHRSLN